MKRLLGITGTYRKELLYEWWMNRKAITVLQRAMLPLPCAMLRARNQTIEGILGYGWQQTVPPADVDDTVRCCPDCEKPNQFGELCVSCQSEAAVEAHDYETADALEEGGR